MNEVGDVSGVFALGGGLVMGSSLLANISFFGWYSFLILMM